MRVAIAACVAIAGCGGKKHDGGGGEVTQAQDLAGSDDVPKRAALTAKALAPQIHELGADDVVPSSVVIELAAAVIDRDRLNSQMPGTVLKITPEIPGALTQSGLAELTFRPFRPFEFDTTYQVELQSIETVDGVIKPDAGTKWTYTFKTPPFKVLGWAPVAVDLDKHVATMDVAFSGHVLPNIAKAAMVFSVGGTPVTTVGMQASHRQDIVTVTLSDPKIVAGAKLALASKKDLLSMTMAKAPAAAFDYTVTNDKIVSIKTATLVEGAGGYYLEVVCDDAAAPKGNRGYYEQEGYYGLSQRCQLSEEAIKHVHFTPEVKKAYITAGRAGFRVFGEFHRGVYKVKIDGGVTSVDGGVLAAPFGASFAVSGRRPQLSFAASGRYLPRTAWTNLGIRHINVDTANLIVRQVPAENLIYWLGEDSDAATERTSNVILKKTVPLRGDIDAQATSWLDVAQLLPATTKGVLELKLIGVGSTATSRLLLTNLSLVAKKTQSPKKPWEQTVQVWALDMDSANLLGGVDVQLVRKSGKIVAKCTTKGSDGCTLAVKGDGDPDEAVPFAIIAKKGDDLTYLRYQDLKADVTESNISGAPYVIDTPYRAAIFSDRGVYRPGDTAHVVAIVRDAKDKAPDQPLPIDVQVIDPRTKVVRKLALKTNAAGQVLLDQAFPAFADTGHWRVVMTVADKPLVSHDLQVEEFVPERMKVTIKGKRDEVLAGDKLAFDVGAQYLFGGSAMDSGVELTCTAEPERFSPDENSDLTYGVEPKGKPVPLGENRGQLGPDGKLAIACPDGLAAFTETTHVTATAAVLEAGSGRATVKTADVTIHPEKFYIGVKTKVPRASSGDTFTVEGMLVDWTGKPAPNAAGTVQVELAHLEADYGYGYDENTGEQRYDRWLRAVPEGKREVKVAGATFSFDVTPGNADAGYLVRVKAGKARTELVLEGEYPYEYYGYEGEERADQTPRPAKPTTLALTAAHEVKVGDAVEVSARSPYKGRVLWTVETDHLVASEWKDAVPGENKWSFEVDHYTPNVYVSAFVVKDPHLESKDAFMPDRAFGVASVKVTPTAFTQTVKLEAPKEVRSSSPLSIALDVGKPDGAAFATVAVVDEGILQLTSFPTPDPLSQLFTKRALGVETYETIGWTMLHQPAGASSKTGGGDDGMSEAEGGALGKDRVQPVKPVALFSGIVPIGPDGRVTIPFSVPQYRGELRVMAVVATPTHVGRAEAKVKVRDPLTVQVTFPRFVTQNDELQVPIFLTNLSGGPLDVTLHLDSTTVPLAGLAPPKSTTPPLVFTGKDSGSVKLADGFSETLVFPVKAAMAVGGGKLRVVATAKGPKGTFEVKDDVDVPFLPAGPKEHVIQKFKVEPGTLDLAAKATALKGWLPTSETTTFWLTNNPYGESFQHLDYLIHYPYGCIEQTTSTTRPLLYIGSIAEQVDPQLAELKIEDMVLSGIDRVLSMETPSGGFGYWPGATEPLEWATAYATDMLLDAQKAGYTVPKDRIDNVLKWIDGRVTQYERGMRVHHDKWNHYDDQSEAYLHYVLARAGKGKKARILKLIVDMPAKGLDGEEQEDLYMLKAALYLAGDRRYEKDLKAVDTSPIAEDRINSWSFYSDRRRRGLMLSTFHDLFGNDPAGELLAQRVAEGLVGHASWYYNTQELVWGVTGLGKWVAAQAAKGTADGKLVADGATITARSSKHKSNDRTWSLMRASEYKQLTFDVPQQTAGMWLVVNSEGVKANGAYKTGGNGLAIKRTYKTLDGVDIDISQEDAIKLGDILFVEVDITNTTGAVIQNIALVDRFPAGFEIENPRLGRSTKPEWIKDETLWGVDFMNMRDDHIEAFGQLAPKQSASLYYSVRAVTSGKFTVPPAEAGAMYDATLWARDKGGTAIVSGPWTGKTL